MREAGRRARGFIGSAGSSAGSDVEPRTARLAGCERPSALFDDCSRRMAREPRRSSRSPTCDTRERILLFSSRRTRWKPTGHRDAIMIRACMLRSR